MTTRVSLAAISFVGVLSCDGGDVPTDRDTSPLDTTTDATDDTDAELEIDVPLGGWWTLAPRSLGSLGPSYIGGDCERSLLSEAPERSVVRRVADGSYVTCEWPDAVVDECRIQFQFDEVDRQLRVVAQGELRDGCGGATGLIQIDPKDLSDFGRLPDDDPERDRIFIGPIAHTIWFLGEGVLLVARDENLDSPTTLSDRDAFAPLPRP